MSRVKSNQKFLNIPKYDQSVYGPFKVQRFHTETEDYHKASSLSSWLFIKYDMSYKTFRSKSKNRREALKREFSEDTGRGM